MDEEKLKEAFQRIKEDISNLSYQIELLTSEIYEIKRTSYKTDIPDRQTDRQKTQTVPYEVEGSKPLDSKVSIGNQGVQTDRQTNRQTDRQTEKFALSSIKTSQGIEETGSFELSNKAPLKDPISKIDKVADVLSSLDNLKKDLRSQFKKLTAQEMLVFSKLYEITDQGLIADYSLLSAKTKLSESSIRDYIQKIIKKGIPIEKIKENNKKVTLSISQDFKRMATLSTINTLREL
jgi:hypothetical protein